MLVVDSKNEQLLYGRFKQGETNADSGKSPIQLLPVEGIEDQEKVREFIQALIGEENGTNHLFCKIVLKRSSNFLGR